MIYANNHQAERAVLAACLLSEAALADCIERLEPHHFELLVHRSIFRGIVAVDKAGETVDANSVSEWLERNDPDYDVVMLNTVHAMGSEYESATGVRQAARSVREAAIDRRLHRAGLRIAEIAAEKHTPDVRDSMIDKVISAVYETQAVDQAPPLEDAVTQTMARIRQAADGEAFGLTTSYQDVDEILAGMQSGQLIVVAARPGMGKSAFIMNIAQNVADAGTAVAVFSCEMSAPELGMRMISRSAQVPLGAMRNHADELDESQWQQMKAAADRIAKLPLYVDDRPPYTISSIRARARRAVRTRGVELIVVDYLQLLEAPGENRQVQVAEISRSLKVMARELDVPVLVAAQLSRQTEQRQDKKPVLSDLRDSGAIEQDADVVIFPWRADYYEPGSSDSADIIVAKQRNGAVGSARLRWRAATVEFVEPRKSARGGPVPNVERDDIPWSTE